MLAEHRISGLPVVGERLQVLGVVSEADILLKEQVPGRSTDASSVGCWQAAEPDPKLSARTAGEAMTSPAITMGAGAGSAAARLMTENGIKRLPVVDSNGTLIGIVTRADLVRIRATGCGDRARDPRGRDVPRSGLRSRASPCGSSRAR